jgi:hypothetical protein
VLHSFDIVLPCFTLTFDAKVKRSTPQTSVYVFVCMACEVDMTGVSGKRSGFLHLGINTFLMLKDWV